MKILGIDLGTTNTYVFAAKDGPGIIHAAPPTAIIMEGVSDSHGSIATVVLYEDDKPIALGNIAEEEFYANGAKRPRRFLATQFKPEISGGKNLPMRWMKDFLSLLLQALPENTVEPDTIIYVGMPSLAREDYSINLAECFRLAGWPRPVFARESDAALISCLQSDVLGIEDIQKKCLIVDFGGGTLDFTAVEGIEALQNGGDILYGGRLFDDLFYQLFCRVDPIFAAQAPFSPAAWHLHWIECREQKEEFSTFLASHDDTLGLTLKADWITGEGEIRQTFVPGYTHDDFVRDAENYVASAPLLEMLAPYRDRAGISRTARELLEGKRIGLISWFREVLEKVANKGSVTKIILTGGSSRWPFVSQMVARVFPKGKCVMSARDFEDIAFGLALFPILSASHAAVEKILRQKLPGFAQKAANLVKELVQGKTEKAAAMCADRIVEFDMMPVLEQAGLETLTVGELEQKFAERIRQDSGLREIIAGIGESLRNEIQKQLSLEFRSWLRVNGVLLTPSFEFPASNLGNEFFDRLDLRLTDLDAVKLTRVALTAVLPLLAGATAAHMLAPLGEPVSISIGIGFTGGAAWLATKAAPGLLDKMKVPSFMLTEKIRAKLIAKNRQKIQEELAREFNEVQRALTANVEAGLKTSLQEMLEKLTLLNQVKTS